MNTFYVNVMTKYTELFDVLLGLQYQISSDSIEKKIICIRG